MAGNFASGKEFFKNAIDDIKKVPQRIKEDMGKAKEVGKAVVDATDLNKFSENKDKLKAYGEKLLKKNPAKEIATSEED